MIGIDEVGRGAWAGPLLVVAYRLSGRLPAGLTDSKLLTPARRHVLAASLGAANEKSIQSNIGEGWVSPAEIDKHGLAAAMRLGVERALTAINALADEAIIMDGTVNYCPAWYSNVQCVVKADLSVPAVSAASIWAKVTRDQHMSELAAQFPTYGFEKHVGYGTAKHLAAIKQSGVCEQHRCSYKPIKLALAAAGL